MQSLVPKRTELRGKSGTSYSLHLGTRSTWLFRTGLEIATILFIYIFTRANQGGHPPNPGSASIVQRLHKISTLRDFQKSWSRPWAGWFDLEVIPALSRGPSPTASPWDSLIFPCICRRLCHSITKQSHTAREQKPTNSPWPWLCSLGARAKHTPYLCADVSAHTRISFALQKKLSQLWPGSQAEGCRTFSLQQEGACILSKNKCEIQITEHLLLAVQVITQHPWVAAVKGRMTGT